MTNNILEFRDVWKTYKMMTEEVNALRGINLTVSKGEFIAVVGPSGSGKSTLLHLASLIDTASRGTILINGKDVKSMSSKEMSKIRRKNIGFIFQRFNLMPQLTALENVMLPMIEPNEEKAKNLLDKVELKDKYEKFQKQLSGEEQQRVAIARALANDPSILLADEPTGELGTQNANLIMELIKKLNEKDGITIILSTHNQFVAQYAGKIIQIHDGTIN
ncbi:ABC transporter ATP-binding protein [Methanobacterium sp. ACI-7]|uniref:ABC transporter ATP-binding protein n=1 Tax=unclassified Methanobacterium TaxID=2627676 RepID=UPI0039C47D9E